MYIYIYSYIYNIYVYIYVLYRYLFHTQKSFAQMGSQVPSIGTVKLSSLDLGRRRIDPTRRGAVEQRGRHCVTYGGEGLFFPQRCGHDFLLWWDGLVFFLVNSCFRVRKRKTREEEIDSRKNKFCKNLWEDFWKWDVDENAISASGGTGLLFLYIIAVVHLLVSCGVSRLVAYDSRQGWWPRG